MKIFLSYAAEDRTRAEEVELALVGAKHQVFFDRKSLPAGGDYISRIQKAVENADLFVFLVSPDSVAQGSYALSELKYARDKWPHPKDRVIPVILRETSFDAIPAYLKSVSILEKEGNTAADVVAAVASRGGEKSRRMKWMIGTAIALLVAVALSTSLFVPPESSSPDSLAELREQARRVGASEYVADGETVSITAYPSLVEIEVQPPGTPPMGRSLSLTPGQSLDFRFKEPLVGVGIYYKQGLYPSNFNFYFADGSEKVVSGKGYFPATGFIGEVSKHLIQRIIVQPQAAGNLSITGMHLFAKGKHERVLR